MEHKTTILGYLIKDAEVTPTKKEGVFFKLGIAAGHEGYNTHFYYGDFYVSSEKAIDFFGEVLVKGTLVYAEGFHKTEKYTKDGEEKKCVKFVITKLSVIPRQKGKEE